MSWFIFFFYLLLFSWLITRMRFFRNSGLNRFVLVGLFTIKVAAGLAYLQFHSLPQYRQRADTWKFYERSLPETQLLKKDPVGFTTELFRNYYPTTGGLFADKNSYWNDVKDRALVKLVAVTNVFTNSNFHADIIFFNFLFFIGLVAFYRLMRTLYRNTGWQLVAAVFLVPSFLFWCSGIHKDGLIFSALGLSFYSFQAILEMRRRVLHVLVLVSCLLLIFVLRNYLAIVLVAALGLGGILHVFPRRRLATVAIVLITGVAIGFSAKYIHPALDIPGQLAEKQRQFMALEGGSRIETRPLEPTFAGFVAALPAAIDMAFLRPHPGEAGAVSWIASMEIILCWLLLGYCIYRRSACFGFAPVAVACVVFALITLLIIGYTVPFSGAVVRYRALVLPLLLAPYVASTFSKSAYIRKK
ncbi:MAG TPA: hypothetical protein VF145_11325 [Chitinophagaceae bacterium]